MNAVVLKVEGLGHIPSFKNKKRICQGRLITRPDIQEWMKRCVRSFVYQLNSLSPTTVAVTSTGCSQPSWTASLPHDDCWQVVPEIEIQAVKVPKGNEGAIITITKL